MIWLFLLGLGIRLVLARYSTGLHFDVALFRQWSDRLVQGGPAHFYAPGYFADYPPGYLYVLLILGKVSRLLLGGPPSVEVLKLPAVFADLGVAAITMLLAPRVAPAAARRGPIRAAAAAAILFNPALILVSAVWGQVDSVLAFLVLAGLFAFAAGRPSFAREACGAALLAIAVATKPQALLALPIVAVVLARRHLGSGVPTWRAWSTLASRAGVLALLAVVVLMTMFRPFGLGLRDLPTFYRDAGAVYRFTSLWAFNAWGAVGFYRPDVGPGAVAVAGVAAYQVGLVVCAIATIALGVRSWQALNRGVPASAVAVFGTAAVTCAAFALLTRMHERYLYLAVACLAPLIEQRPWRWPFTALSACFLLNLHFVYVFFAQHSTPPDAVWTIQPLYDLCFGTTRDAWQLKALSIVTAAACLSVAGLGWRVLDRAPDRA